MITQPSITTLPIPSRVGGTIAFDVSAFYNTPSSPGIFSGFDFNGAVSNTEVIGYFNNSALPNFGSGSFVIGNWNPNALNSVRIIYRDVNNIIVVITSAQGTQANIDTRLTLKRLSADASNPNLTGLTIIDLTFDYEKLSTYDLEWFLHIGAGAAGQKVGFTFGAGASFDVSRVAPLTPTIFGSGTQGLAASGTLGSTAYAQGMTNANMICRGLLITGSTAGTISMQFAAVTASQTAFVYAAGSLFKASKIA